MLIDTGLQNTALSSAGSSSHDPNRSKPLIAQGGADGGKNLTMPGSDQPEEPQQVTQVSLAEAIEELLFHEPKEIYIDLDGYPSVTPQQKDDKEYFGHIGLVLDNLLSSRMSKVHTVIHVDGPRSLEKETEHKRRDERLQKSLGKLTITATKDKLESGLGLKAVYRMCRSAYRLPPEALEPVLGTTYYKDELLIKLDLPSPAHLALVSIVTGNDYTRGVPYYGLVSNTAAIRDFDFGVFGAMTGQDLVKGFQRLVDDYLGVVKAKAEDTRKSAGQRQQQRRQRRTPPPESKAERRDQKRIDRADLQLTVTVADFQGAIGAFVSCQESPQSTDGSQSPPAYDVVRSTLLELEMRKARINSYRVKRIGVAAKTRDASHVAESLMDAGESSSLIAPAASASQQGYFDSGHGGSEEGPILPAPMNRMRDKEGPKALKKSFGGAFKTLVLTAGSLWGCLRRDTDLTSEEIAQVVNRIDRAVFVMNSAKHVVLKMLEFFIHDVCCLCETKWAEPRDSGEVIIRNLISFALRGSASTQTGRKAEKPDPVRSYTLAISIFGQFQALHPPIKALNPDHIPLSKVQQDLVPKICLAIKMHYRKLPTIIVDKMEKIGVDPSTIPSYDGEEEEEEKEEDNSDEFRDEEEEAIKKSDKIVFEAGHIMTWWDEMLRLPFDQRPRFCISTQLGDSFLDISEEALLAMLWGETSGDEGRTMEAKVRSKTDAKVDQESDYGGLMRRLFIGKPEDLVNKEVRQTTYGKKTTTMQELSSSTHRSTDKDSFPATPPEGLTSCGKYAIKI
ncbi:hypothetical protein BGZ90_010572 [Linnemannia elongata]|nr:hypothetical protein BGZ90_010572 [Linnemannia elongata]